MKFLAPFLSAVVIAQPYDLAREIGRRVATPNFAEFIASRVRVSADVQDRVPILANIAEHLKSKICTSTMLFLAVNNKPDTILTMGNGLPYTLEAQKEILCRKYFEDNPLTCYQVVDAVSQWCSADLCSNFAIGLDREAALRFNVCRDHMVIEPMN